MTTRMPSPFMLGNFSNLIGLDGILIFGVQIAFVVGLILLVIFIVLRSISGQTVQTLEVRLQTLDSIRRSGTITEAEYQEQRQRILSQL